MTCITARDLQLSVLLDAIQAAESFSLLEMSARATNICRSLSSPLIPQNASFLISVQKLFKAKIFSNLVLLV